MESQKFTFYSTINHSEFIAIFVNFMKTNTDIFNSVNSQTGYS